jgi:Tectonin domain
MALIGSLVAFGACVASVASVVPASAAPSVALVSSSQWGPDAGGLMHVVGQVVNNGPGIASAVELSLNFYSSSNALLGNAVATASIDDMNPGDRSPFEEVFAPPTGYDHYGVSAISPSEFPVAPNHYFSTTVTGRSIDALGDTHFVGTVRNNNTTTATFVNVVFTFFNASGTVVATGSNYLSTNADSDLLAGQLGSFQEVVLTSDPAFPGFSTYSVRTQSDTPPSPPPPPFFTPRPGGATDIAVGANGAVWVVGTKPVNGGFGIYHWNGSTWAQVQGGAVKIAVGPGGNPWVANSAHRIYHWNGQTWVLYPGGATDIAVGANGAVWVVGTKPVNGGFGIYEWNGSAWAQVQGGAVAIAVAPNGSPWVANLAHLIFAH